MPELVIMTLPLGPQSVVLLEPVGGIAGDMFAAAATDCWPALIDVIERNVRLAGVPSSCSLAWKPTLRAGVTALQLQITCTDKGGHSAKGLADILEDLSRSSLPRDVYHHAEGIFSHIGEAESRVHGVKPTEVVLHELSEWDSIIDIIAAATVISAVGDVQWHVGPLPLGSGVVRTAHGFLPVPAPAVLHMCQGARVRQDGIVAERVTPTGAAILCHLNALGKDEWVEGRLDAIGIGAGSRDLPELPNILRLQVISRTDVAKDDVVSVLTFDIDDQTPEDLAIAIDVLRDLPDVLSAAVFTGLGKKGRPIFHVEILVRPTGSEDTIECCFRQTSTLGVRWRLERRSKLPRTSDQVELSGYNFRVKRTLRPPGVETSKVESGDLANKDWDYGERHRLRRAIEDKGHV